MEKMVDIYCVCCKQLLDNDNLRNVFNEKLLINSQEKDVHEELNSYVTLRDAIELITGYTISEVDNAILCETCFHKVECYMKFRSQLVALFGRLNNAQTPDLDSPCSENVDITNASLITKACNTGSDVSKEIMSINETNVPSNCSNLSSSENNSSCSTSLPSTFRHHIDNASDYGSDIDDNLNVDTFRSKIQKSDIESDVNVYSGEDDEVLELPYKHNETINISSTESEEDCDYGPTFKKIKVSSRLSSPLILS